jgi:hypothetical protein
MEFGKCKLCLLDKDLQESHLMPRALYKRTRRPGAKGNRDPVLITKASNKPSSYQIKDCVLCRDCEDLFNRGGEDYAMRLVADPVGNFPLLETLEKIKPTMEHSLWRAYSVADTPDIDRDKIAYFAISVYWRASVHTWKYEDGSTAHIDLGARYNEEIRKYLLGQTGIPRNIALQVVVCSDIVNKMSFFAPHENQKLKDRTHIFLACGFQFFFRVSNTPNPHQQRLSIVNNPDRWLTIRDCSINQIWKSPKQA